MEYQTVHYDIVDFKNSAVMLQYYGDQVILYSEIVTSLRSYFLRVLNVGAGLNLNYEISM